MNLSAAQAGDLASEMKSYRVKNGAIISTRFRRRSSAMRIGQKLTGDGAKEIRPQSRECGLTDNLRFCRRISTRLFCR